MTVELLLSLTTIASLTGYSYAFFQCNTDTSEGFRTLQHGEYACAPLGSNSVESDKGKHFIICNNGYPASMSCPPLLRFDLSSKTCNWPDLASCSFHGSDTTVAPTMATTTEAKSETTPIEESTTTTATTTTHQPEASTPSLETDPPLQNATHPPLPSGRCWGDTCQLPDCFCYGASPSNISVSDTPMFIMLTFDDAITPVAYDQFLRDLLIDNKYSLYNPSGCNIRATFYLSHNYTDYSLVETLGKAGHEIASHTINHRLPSGRTSTDYQDIVDEIVGLKTQVEEKTKNETLANSVIGFRAPFLEVAGNMQFDVLRDFGFLYDASVPNLEIQSGRNPLWPFTLDFVMDSCVHPPCPTQPYPGLWEVPMNSWIGDNGWSCPMIDSCTVSGDRYDGTEQDWYNFYRRNFDDSFYPLRIPMGVSTHAAMFAKSSNSYAALVTFLKDVLDKGDVWMATPTQVIRWIQTPVTNRQMLQEMWGC